MADDRRVSHEAGVYVPVRIVAAPACVRKQHQLGAANTCPQPGHRPEKIGSLDVDVGSQGITFGIACNTRHTNRGNNDFRWF